MTVIDAGYGLTHDDKIAVHHYVAITGRDQYNAYTSMSKGTYRDCTSVTVSTGEAMAKFRDEVQRTANMTAQYRVLT